MSLTENLENLRYYYKATVKKVVDGDTIVCDIDMGFDTVKKEVNCRFKDYNSPEKRGLEKDKGRLAEQHLKTLLEGKDVLIRTNSIDSFGRCIIDIFVCQDKEVSSLITTLIQEGWGKYWDYKLNEKPRFNTDEVYPLKLDR